MSEYHLAIHLSGEQGRNVTAIDLSRLCDYLDKIRCERYVACIEPATKDHLHCVYQLCEDRPNIKRDIINALGIDTKKYPNNAVYNKKLKVGQTFLMVGGGYLQKGYKFIRTKGVSHNELDEGKEEYDNLVARKVIRLSKHDFIRHLSREIEESKTPWKKWREVLKSMLRSPLYNFSYVMNVFTEEQIHCLLHFKFEEPSENDEYALNNFFKEVR